MPRLSKQGQTIVYTILFLLSAAIVNITVGVTTNILTTLGYGMSWLIAFISAIFLTLLIDWASDGRIFGDAQETLLIFIVTFAIMLGVVYGILYFSNPFSELIPFL